MGHVQATSFTRALNSINLFEIASRKLPSGVTKRKSDFPAFSIDLSFIYSKMRFKCS